MIKPVNSWFCLLLISLGITPACKERTGEGVDRSESETARIVTAAGDTVIAERFNSPASFTVPFVTFLPDGMKVDVSGTEEAVTFFEGGGARSVNTPFVHVLVYPQNTDERRARTFVEAYAASRGVPMSEEESLVAPLSEEGIAPEGGSTVNLVFSWAVLEVPYAYSCAGGSTDCAIGRIALGRTGDRFFHFVVQYPPSRARHFVPRADIIISRWSWQ